MNDRRKSSDAFLNNTISSVELCHFYSFHFFVHTFVLSSFSSADDEELTDGVDGGATVATFLISPQTIATAIFIASFSICFSLANEIGRLHALQYD